MLRFVLLVALASPAFSQWISGCGQSPYSDPASGQAWTTRSTVINGEPRIVGGVQARDNEFPWQVSMVRVTGSHFCGGSILNNNYVITAAHCTDGMTAAGITVYTGRTRISVGSDGTAVDVLQIKQNSAYMPAIINNDISLLRTANMPTTSIAKGVCAPSGSDQYTNNAVTVSGWGTTSYGGSLSNTLLYTNVWTMTNNACSSYSGYGTVTDQMLCTAVNSPGRDACQGDSGGPLVYNTGSSFQLIGLVSWGINCATNPGVYTRVGEFLTWISVNT